MTSSRRTSRRVSRRVKDEDAIPGSAVRKRKPAVHRQERPKSVKRRKHVLRADTKIVHLAMSPKAANLLRTIIARSRHDEPELEAIEAELNDQL